MKKTKEELSRIRAEIGRRGAIKSAETYARRRKLKEIQPQLEKWIDDIVYDRMVIGDVPEQYREYVMVIAQVQKAEITKLNERIGEAERLLAWRQTMGFDGEDDE